MKRYLILALILAWQAVGPVAAYAPPQAGGFPSPAQLSQADQADFAGFLSRVQMQINRLTGLISTRNEKEAQALMSQELQQKGLARYLADLPAFYGEVSSEIKSAPQDKGDAFEIILYTQTGHRFLATMQWQELGGHLKLTRFNLRPYQLDIAPELRSSLEDFVMRLQIAIQIADWAGLRALLSPGAQHEQLEEFLKGLRPTEPWSVEYIALEPLSITISVPHAAEFRFLLNAGLIAGEENWLIHALEVLPLW